MWTLTTFKKKTESVLFHEHFKHHKNSGTIQWILGTQEPMATSFENEYGWRRAVEMLGWLCFFGKNLLIGKKVNCLLKVALALRQVNSIHKKGP